MSLLKDITSEDSVKKFSKQNLDEIKNIGFSYKGLKDGIFKSTGMSLQTKIQELKSQGKQSFYASETSK